MIKIEVYNHQARLLGVRDMRVLKDLDFELSYRVLGYQFMNVPGWDGRYRLFKKSGYFPIGLLERVEDILNKYNIDYKKIDLRIIPEYNESIKILDPYRLREYQKEILKIAIHKESGIIRAVTGAGKSLIIAALVAHYNIPAVIYVVSVDLLYQMVDSLKKFYGIDAGIIGDGIVNIKKINVATIWSAASAFKQKVSINDSGFKKDFKKINNKKAVMEMCSSANIFILDEAQYAGSDTFQFLNKVSKNAYHRFLLSGTPWRESGDDILLEASCGPKIVDVNAEKLIKLGFLVKPLILYKKVKRMKNVGDTYHEVYKNFITENTHRNNLIVSATKKLLENNKKILILYKQLKHGKIIQDLLNDENINSLLLHGKISSAERKSSIESVKNGEHNVILASTIFDQGVDIPILDGLILAGGGSSTGKLLQRIGRVIRSYEGKEEAIVIDFIDNCKYLKDHSKKRIKTLNLERGFQVAYI